MPPSSACGLRLSIYISSKDTRSWLLSVLLPPPPTTTYLSSFPDAILHLTCVIIWFHLSLLPLDLAQWSQEPDLVFPVIVSSCTAQCPACRRKSVNICWFQKGKINLWLKRDLPGKLHCDEKRLNFLSALLRMGKRPLRCAGCKEILGWIANGGCKIYLQNIDSCRICVKR